MNSNTKKFLLTLATVAVAGWLAVNWLLGPPGLSSEYLAATQGKHEQYLEAIKSDSYKHYIQRPHLADLENDPHLRHFVALVEEYESNSAFKAEQHRIHLYSLFFEFFNAGIVVVLVLRLAKAPLLQYLDGQIDELRDKINQAARSRKSAVGRRAAVEDKLAHIDEEELKVNATTEARLERELAELAEANHYSLGLHQRELAERKKAEIHAAELAVKRKIVETAMESLTAQIKSNQTAENHDRLIQQFATDLEAQS